MAMKALARWRGSGAACVLLGVLLLALLNRENILPADEEAKAAVLPPDLAKVPSDAIVLVSGRVADLWNSELNKSVCQKLAEVMFEDAREFEKKFGLPLDDVERLTLAIRNVRGPEEPLLFVGTTKAYDRDKVIAVGDKGKEEKYKGQTFYVKGTDAAVYLLGERALVIGNPQALRGLLDSPAKNDGNLTAALRLAAGKHSLVCALNVKAFNDAVGARLPGEAEPFKPLLQARYGTLILDLGAESRAEAKLTFASDKAAKAAIKPARTGLELTRGGLEGVVEYWSKEKEMSQLVELLKQVQGSLNRAQVEQEGKTLRASAQLKVDVATAGPILVKAVEKARESAARAQSTNNLKQIAVGMHNYHSTYNLFPPQAAYDKNGKPMLSWRVMILPFIEQQELYKRFRFNEPWDSEHNKKLLALMPKTYASPNDLKTVKDHTTHYQGFVGKGAFFEGKQGLPIAAITDGTSNTFMIVEASKAVPWTKPEDLLYDPAKPLPKLGLPGAGGFLASICDGSVRFCSHKIAEKTLRLVIERDDGMPIPADF